MTTQRPRSLHENVRITEALGGDFQVPGHKVPYSLSRICIATLGRGEHWSVGDAHIYTRESPQLPVVATLTTSRIPYSERVSLQSLLLAADDRTLLLEKMRNSCDYLALTEEFEVGRVRLPIASESDVYETRQIIAEAAGDFFGKVVTQLVSVDATSNQ